MSVTPFLSIPVLALIVALQSAFFSYMPILGIPVQVVVVVVLAFAMWRGAAEGVFWAFVGGLYLDYFSISTLGVSSVALILAVLATAPFYPNLFYNRLTLPILLAGLGMLTFQLTNLLLLRFTGYPISNANFSGLPVTVVLHALATVPFFWLFSSFDRFTRTGREINI